MTKKYEEELVDLFQNGRKEINSIMNKILSSENLSSYTMDYAAKAEKELDSFSKWVAGFIWNANNSSTPVTSFAITEISNEINEIVGRAKRGLQ